MQSVIHSAHRIVVKVGSSLVTNDGAGLDHAALERWASEIADLMRRGKEVVLVSSGAIAEGIKRLGWSAKPSAVHEKQAAAAVGQMGLCEAYERVFTAHNLKTAQVLLTHEDMADRTRYLNARTTLLTLLSLNVVPIINENDSLASNEIRFGDNDRLSALIANIVVADALVLLTDVDALYTAPPSEPGSKRISYVPNVEDALAKVQVGGTGSNVGTGGMVTKMEAARVAAVSGIPAVLTCASNAGPAMMGDPVGTAFAPINDRGSSRRLWIGFASHPQGTLVADSGAAKAVRGGAASLLAAGVVEVKGDFAAGDAVWVDDEQGNHLAKGLVGFDSEEIPQMLGRNTAQLKRFLGEEYAHPLVHRDNLVLV